MKKFASLLLSLCMVLSLCVPVFAADTAEPAWDSPVNVITSSGGTASVPVKLTFVGSTTSTGGDSGTKLNFRVQLPTNLPVSVNSEGYTVTAPNAYITNLSSGAVEVKNVAIEPVNGWRVVRYGSDMSGSRVNTKTFSMCINHLESRPDVKGNLVYDQDAFMQEFSRKAGTNYLWAASYGYNGSTEKWGPIPSSNGRLRVAYGVDIPAQNLDQSSCTIANVLFTVGFAYVH